MSPLRKTSAAFDPAISAPAYRLLGLLAAYANKDGSCWPSVPTLASDLRVTERRVRQLLNEIAPKYIEITERPGHSSVYRVLQPRKPSFTPLTPEAELQSGSPPSGTPEAHLPRPLKPPFREKGIRKDTKKELGPTQIRLRAEVTKLGQERNALKKEMKALRAELKKMRVVYNDLDSMGLDRKEQLVVLPTVNLPTPPSCKIEWEYRSNGILL